MLIQRARADAGDVWVIGHLPCPISKGTADEIWLPQYAGRELTVFRIDRDLLKPHSASHRAWNGWGCRGFVLSIQQSKSSVWDQLRAFVRNWDKIENHIHDRRADRTWNGRITANRVAPV